MIDAGNIREHMEVVGADGVHVGRVDHMDGDRVKLTTLSAGMTFGEMALGTDDRQQATEKADGPVQVMVLTAESIDQLEEEDPRLAAALWKALTRDAHSRVDQYLRETAIRIRH